MSRTTKLILTLFALVPAFIMLTMQGISLYQQWSESRDPHFKAYEHAEYLRGILSQEKYCLQNFPGTVPIPKIGQLVLYQIVKDNIVLAEAFKVYNSGKIQENDTIEGGNYQILLVSLQQGGDQVNLNLEFRWYDSNSKGLVDQPILVPIPEVFINENGTFKCKRKTTS